MSVADRSPHVKPAVYLTADVPGIGGRIKERPEDFLVDELPLYEPCGEGEHIYMLVEKRGLSTMDLVGVLARHFGVRRGDIGYAGLKDKQAVTRQVVSVHVPGRKIEDYPMLQHERIGVLWADYHTNKLRPGHLRGNRFSIRVRGVPVSAVLSAKRGLEMLGREGVPNRIGEQRFGASGNNHLVGRGLVLGDAGGVVELLVGATGENHAESRRLFAEGKLDEALAALPGGARTERQVILRLLRGGDARAAVRTIGDQEKGFFVSAFQSAVFNAALDERLKAGTLGALFDGDVAVKHENGALFNVGAAEAADPEIAARLKRFEISPSGPLWGASMKRAAGKTDELELELLRALGVSVEDLVKYDGQRGNLLTGKRRPLRVPMTLPDVEAGMDEHGAFVRVAFDLPAGSFATTVLEELMKTGAGEGEAAAGGAAE